MTLPIVPLQLLMIRNTGSNNLQVTWTPNGGSSAVIQTITPTSFIHIIQSSSGQGVSNVSVQAITAPTTMEYVFAG